MRKLNRDKKCIKQKKQIGNRNKRKSNSKSIKTEGEEKSENKVTRYNKCGKWLNAIHEIVFVVAFLLLFNFFSRHP